jgi:hypothetical protein
MEKRIAGKVPEESAKKRFAVFKDAVGPVCAEMKKL